MNNSIPKVYVQEWKEIFSKMKKNVKTSWMVK